MANFFSNIKTRYQAWTVKIVNLTRNTEDEKMYGEGWDRLGYHRPIARYLYDFGLLIPQIIFGLILLPLVKYTELRYPEMGMFETASAGLFGALYTILDLDLQTIIERFVPQFAVSNPKKATQYVTFFIKYQMWSGLVQILFVSSFMFLYIIPKTNFAYLAWFILFINQKQYPAILSTFQDTIGAFQHGAKEKLIVFYRASVLEPLTKIGGGLIGLYFGMQNPAIGEMVGMAIGFAIGSYVDDFLTFGLGMYWLSKILDKFNIRIWEVYGQEVPKDVWQSALTYAMKLFPRTVFGTVAGFFSFLITYENLAGYASYTGYFKMADNLRKYVGWSDDILNGSTAAFTESFTNGKVNLTKYYIGEGLKYNYLFFMFLGGLNIFGLPIILKIALGVFLNDSWAMVGTIVPIQIALYTLHSPYDDIANKMINMSKHPEIQTYLGIAGTLVNLFFTYYFLMVLDMGWMGIILIPLPWTYTSLIIKWIYMHKKILKLDMAFWKDMAWQTYIAPLDAGAIYVLFMLAVLLGVWPIISAPFSGDLLLVPLIVCLVLLVLGLLLLYFPLISWFGFWDERSLNTFRRAVALSGPSLWLIYPMYKIFNAFYKKSPFKKQSYFKLGDIAEVELQELMVLRHESFVEYMKNNPNNNTESQN